MSDIFLCYSRVDATIANRLVERLQAESWSVFIDRNTHVGRRWHKEIERELHSARAVVVLWSATSRDSDYVLEEAEYGKRKDILFPVFIERVEFPYGFGRIQTADLIGWNDGVDHAGLQELLTPLRLHLNGHMPETVRVTVPESKPESSNVTVDVKSTVKSSSPAPGQTFHDKLKSGGEGPLMVNIPVGRFYMGPFLNEPGRSDGEAGSQHKVHIARPFAMGVYPVTFDDYDLFCQQSGRRKPRDEDWGRTNRPVIHVSWHDAQDYCAWLSQQTGQQYRLPSEAEWEYACRAGTQTPYHFGMKLTQDHANFDKNVGKTTPVGDYPSNAFGLYDMHGNVWEWVEDCWHERYDNAPEDGSAWLEADGGNCSTRVVRGGSWGVGPRLLRSAGRSRYYSVLAVNYLGFRIVRDF